MSFSGNRLSSCQLPAELNFQFLKWTERSALPQQMLFPLLGPPVSVSSRHWPALSSFCSPCKRQATCPPPRLCAVSCLVSLSSQFLNDPNRTLVTCRHSDGSSDCLPSLDRGLREAKSLRYSPPYVSLVFSKGLAHNGSSTRLECI